MHHDNSASELIFQATIDDWDRYEGLQWYATETWANDHRDDTDVETLLRRVRESKTAYLRWGRETLEWAIGGIAISSWLTRLIGHAHDEPNEKKRHHRLRTSRSTGLAEKGTRLPAAGNQLKKNINLYFHFISR
jgi:hypothetical protein